MTCLVDGQSDVYNFTNTTADVLPDLLGPVNGTKALTYILNNSLKVDKDTVSKPFVSDLLDTVDYLFHIIQWIMFNIEQALPPTGPEPSMEDFTKISLVPRILGFLMIMMDSIVNNYPSELTETGGRIWGVVYWGAKNVNCIVENVDVSKVDTVVNDTVYYLPDIIGNDTIGITYILKEGRGNLDPQTPEKLFDMLSLLIQFLAAPMREISSAFPESGTYNQTALSTETGKTLASVLALVEKLLGEILAQTQPELDVFNDRVWSLIYWTVPVVRDISNETQSSYFANFSNTTTDYGSDIIGPLSGSSGITYLLRGYAGMPFSVGVKLLRALFDLLGLAIQFLAEFLQRLPSVMLWR